MQQEEKVHLKECAMQLLSNVCMIPTSKSEARLSHTLLIPAALLSTVIG